MIVKYFLNGKINFHRTNEMWVCSLSTFTDLIEKQLLADGFDVKREQSNTISYKGIKWVLSYNDLDNFNYRLKVQCTAWVKLLSVYGGKK